MTLESVCAVIVTYHPADEILEILPAVLSQVQRLVIVDNGSPPAAVDCLRAASEKFGFHLIENAENFGIAQALNQGVRWAAEQNYPCVILFDQDSRITEGFIEQMFAAWNAHPQKERVAAIHPKYLDPATGKEPLVRRARDGGPFVSMTSGALMPTWIFEKIGGFASEYFIDCVDFEYCLRIRASGYLIADSRTAVLFHAAGRAEQSRKFLGFTYRPTHHNAVRRYYISRNRIVVYRKYFRIFPRAIMQLMYDNVRETIKCFVSERDRPRKFRSFLLGTWDGATGKMGKRDLAS